MTTTALRSVLQLSLFTMSSAPALAWVVESDGLSNDHFDITYGAIDYDDVTQARFNESVGNVIDYWSSLLGNHVLDEKITIDLAFRPLSSTTLGTSAPSMVHCLPSTFYGTATETEFILNTYTPFTTSTGLQFTTITEAQAKVLGYDVDTQRADMTITFNSDFNMYFGDADGKGFATYDFESILLHEIAHGMGAISTLLKSTQGSSTTELNEMITSSGKQLLSPDGEQLYYTTAWDALMDIDLDDMLSYQPGADININAGDVTLDIYNPDLWQAGSSITHPIGGGILDYSLSDLDVIRQFTKEELYLFEAMGFDIPGIELYLIPEPSHSALLLGALPAAARRRRRRL